MKKLTKAWIHCRVSRESERHLLKYQKDILTSLCERNELEVFGISKEVGSGKFISGYYLSTIATMVRRHEIEYIVIYDWTRLLIFQDLYMEFKLFCEMNDVSIIDLQELKKEIHSFLFDVNF